MFLNDRTVPMNWFLSEQAKDSVLKLFNNEAAYLNGYKRVHNLLRN
jgi:hypothetical protein